MSRNRQFQQQMQQPERQMEAMRQRELRAAAWMARQQRERFGPPSRPLSTRLPILRANPRARAGLGTWLLTTFSVGSVILLLALLAVSR